MSKGRKKKPDNMKVLEGTFRQDRANPNAPTSDKLKMEPPLWLAEKCHDWFYEIKTRLSVYKLDTASFTEAVASIAMRIREIEECDAIIGEQGRTYRSETTANKPIVDENGDAYFPQKIMIKGHPAVSQRNEAMRHLQSLLAEFGLTAASISKVGGLGEGKKKSVDPWEQFG